MIIFHLDKVYGKISIWSNNIVEEEIHLNQSDNLLFYLHFTIVNIAQACQLFQKFYQTLIEENHQKDYHIALCCTDGFSTTLFAEQMQEACQLENTHFLIYSLSMDNLYQTYDQYDAIYLAPQIAYMQPKLMVFVENRIPIHRIDPTDFATNNYHAIIETIKKNIIEDKKRYL